MSTRSRCINRIWVVSFILFQVIFLQTVIAETNQEAQAKRQKAQSSIQIAQEQINRGMYTQAQGYIRQIEQEYDSYLSDQQQQTLASMSQEIENAVAQRERITQVLSQVDELKALEQYAKARDLLKSISGSRFLNPQEQQLVEEELANISKNLNADQDKIQALYNQSVLSYRQGNLEQARAGFVQVIESGVPVKGERSPMEYIELIDRQAVQPTPAPTPAAPVAGTDVEAPAESVADQTAQAAAANGPLDPYLNEVRRKRAVQVGYTKAIVNDSLLKADEALSRQEFDAAQEALRRAYAVIERNKLLLGDETYRDFRAQLQQKEEQVAHERSQFMAMQNEQEAQQAENLTQEIRQSMEQQRAEAIESYMDRAYAFQDEQRYEEAIGQLEQLLAIDPLNNRALILKKTLENTILWQEARRIKSEADQEELELLLETSRRAIPYSKEINYPKNWKEIAARREEAMAESMDPLDAAVEQQLSEIVDLSSLSEEMTFMEALEILQNSVDPPLKLIVLWADLNENAFIQQDTPINISGQGLTGVPLRTGLDRLLQAVSSSGIAELGYVVENGIITIATVDSLPTRMRNVVYDVAELLNPPANFDEYNQNSMGGQGGGGFGGGGGGFGGGGIGGGGFGGGGIGGGGFGGGGIGGGGGFGGGGIGGGGGFGGGGIGGGGGGGFGGGGGMMGGGGMGGSVGNWQGRIRGYELIYVIQESIEPDTWYEYGGEGRIQQFSGDKLIVWQTPEIHKQIKEFLDQMKEDLGRQVAIESRFLLVSENFLEDIAIDMDIPRLKIGGDWGGGTGIIGGGIAPDGTYIDPALEQNSSDAVVPVGTRVGSSLATTAAQNPSLEMDFSYGSTLDDLQVAFMIRATQLHANAKQLSAPKAMVLSGESATLDVTTTQAIVTDSEFQLETTTVADGVVNNYATWDRTIDDIPTTVRLTITPTITDDKKYVILRIIAYLTDLVSTTTATTQGFVPDQGIVEDTYSLPTQQYTSIQTRVSVPDRGTVLLGGLTLTAESERESGVPGLSKIPVIGRLFSNRSKVNDKQILLILVKPTIVLREEAEADAIADWQPE